jgi:hypothetical protein
MSRAIQRVGLAVVWLLIVAVVSVGAAGIVASMANPPGAATRPELTMDGDAAAAAALDDAERNLTILTREVERLGELGRGALASMVASDFGALDTSVTEGQSLARLIEEHSSQIHESLVTIPGTGQDEPLHWSAETIRRRDLALTAVTATQSLEADWSRLAAGSTVATRLSTLLTGHDKTAGQAVAQGRQRKYRDALKTLAKAQAMLTDAKTMRDQLANAVDVTTLTQWIDRNDEYDTALARLYHATIDAQGRITQELKDAFVAERKAHDLLPSNTSGIVIILAEIGRGGLNEAVIGIEQARAKLQAAMDSLAGPDSSDTTSPEDASPSPASEGASPDVRSPSASGG